VHNSSSAWLSALGVVVWLGWQIAWLHEVASGGSEGWSCSSSAQLMMIVSGKISCMNDGGVRTMNYIVVVNLVAGVRMLLAIGDTDCLHRRGRRRMADVARLCLTRRHGGEVDTGLHLSA
jgi:hypothetical protein